MAKFCSDDCKRTGSICDFCKHYKDEYRDILKLTKDDGSLRFAGEGICDVDNHETDACDGCGCNNFECFMIKNNDYIETSNEKVKKALDKCNNKYKDAMQKLEDSDIKFKICKWYKVCPKLCFKFKSLFKCCLDCEEICYKKCIDKIKELNKKE